MPCKEVDVAKELKDIELDYLQTQQQMESGRVEDRDEMSGFLDELEIPSILCKDDFKEHPNNLKPMRTEHEVRLSDSNQTPQDLKLFSYDENTRAININDLCVPNSVNDGKGAELNRAREFIMLNKPKHKKQPQKLVSSSGKKQQTIQLLTPSQHKGEITHDFNESFSASSYAPLPSIQNEYALETKPFKLQQKPYSQQLSTNIFKEEFEELMDMKFDRNQQNGESFITELNLKIKSQNMQQDPLQAYKKIQILYKIIQMATDRQKIQDAKDIFDFLIYEIRNQYRQNLKENQQIMGPKQSRCTNDQYQLTNAEFERNDNISFLTQEVQYLRCQLDQLAKQMAAVPGQRDYNLFKTGDLCDFDNFDPCPSIVETPVIQETEANNESHTSSKTDRVKAKELPSDSLIFHNLTVSSRLDTFEQFQSQVKQESHINSMVEKTEVCEDEQYNSQVNIIPTEILSQKQEVKSVLTFRQLDKMVDQPIRQTERQASLKTTLHQLLFPLKNKLSSSSVSFKLEKEGLGIFKTQQDSLFKNRKKKMLSVHENLESEEGQLLKCHSLVSTDQQSKGEKSAKINQNRANQVLKVNQTPEKDQNFETMNTGRRIVTAEDQIDTQISFIETRIPNENDEFQENQIKENILIRRSKQLKYAAIANIELEGVDFERIIQQNYESQKIKQRQDRSHSNKANSLTKGFQTERVDQSQKIDSLKSKNSKEPIFQQNKKQSAQTQDKDIPKTTSKIKSIEYIIKNLDLLSQSHKAQKRQQKQKQAILSSAQKANINLVIEEKQPNGTSQNKSIAALNASRPINTIQTLKRSSNSQTRNCGLQQSNGQQRLSKVTINTISRTQTQKEHAVQDKALKTSKIIQNNPIQNTKSVNQTVVNKPATAKKQTQQVHSLKINMCKPKPKGMSAQNELFQLQQQVQSLKANLQLESQTSASKVSVSQMSSVVSSKYQNQPIETGNSSNCHEVELAKESVSSKKDFISINSVNAVNKTNKANAKDSLGYSTSSRLKHRHQPTPIILSKSSIQEGPKLRTKEKEKKMSQDQTPRILDKHQSKMINSKESKTYALQNQGEDVDQFDIIESIRQNRGTEMATSFKSNMVPQRNIVVVNSAVQPKEKTIQVKSLSLSTIIAKKNISSPLKHGVLSSHRQESFFAVDQNSLMAHSTSQAVSSQLKTNEAPVQQQILIKQRHEKALQAINVVKRAAVLERDVLSENGADKVVTKLQSYQTLNEKGQTNNGSFQNIPSLASFTRSTVNMSSSNPIESNKQASNQLIRQKTVLIERRKRIELAPKAQNVSQIDDEPLDMTEIEDASGLGNDRGKNNAANLQIIGNRTERSGGQSAASKRKLMIPLQKLIQTKDRSMMMKSFDTTRIHPGQNNFDQSNQR